MSVAAFYATYRLKVHTSVLVCSGLQLAWIIVFVILYGWDCGIQHLMFEMLVLVYFAVYNSLVYKVSYTVVLFVVRFSLFLYCRVNISVFALTETATVVLQIINTIVTFVLMAVACSMFSSNVESAEKKLVLYNEQLKKTGRDRSADRFVEPPSDDAVHYGEAQERACYGVYHWYGRY